MAPPFAHEPNAVRSPEGEWVIYMTMRHPAGGFNNCTRHPQQQQRVSSSKRANAAGGGCGGTESGMPEPRHTYMTHSTSPYGPWSDPVLVLKENYSIWDDNTVLIDTNLAVTIDGRGRAVGIWRMCENTKGRINVARFLTYSRRRTGKIQVRTYRIRNVRCHRDPTPSVLICSSKCSRLVVFLLNSRLRDTKDPKRVGGSPLLFDTVRMETTNKN